MTSPAVRRKGIPGTAKPRESLADIFDSIA